MKWLVFSKDRAYQLDAFLRTARDNGKIDLKNVSVLHRYEQKHELQLESVKKEFPGVIFIKETSFLEDVRKWVSEIDSEFISFATDDALFTRDIREKIVEETLRAVEDVFTFSLRMGIQLNYCYPISSSQKIPNGMIDSERFFWRWNGSDGDWSYPLSVDGHVFRKKDLKFMVENCQFKNPNTLESSIQMFSGGIFNRLISCHCISSYFNSPINVVQNVYNNRHGNLTNDELYEKYSQGARFEPSSTSGFLNISAHQEFEI